MTSLSLYISSQVGRFRRVSLYFQEIFRYRLALCLVKGVFQRFKVFVQTCAMLFLNRKIVLFYPDRPPYLFVIHKVFLALGFHLTTNPSEHCDIAMKWRNTIGTGNPFFPPEAALEGLLHKRPNLKILNMNCNDVSKKRVSAVFEEIFGYSTSVDPATYSGKCVMKSDWNGLHVGEIIECPTKVRRDGFVYEKLINNEVGDGFVQDIRAPIFGRTIPFVYLKFRPVQERLVDRSHTLSKTVMAEVLDILSEGEVDKIHQFCEKIGLDCGEIDILRDRNDKKIYIVDVNNDPSGPPDPISGTYPLPAIVRLAQAFEKTFLLA